MRLSGTMLVVVLVAIVVIAAAIVGWYFGIHQKDTDGDGVPDRNDAFPSDSAETVDSDGDGWGDNSDVFPEDNTEWIDTDGDGHGDNSDAFISDPNEWVDTDGDKVGDNADVFPSDPGEWRDADKDGTGDNSDPDDDNDGVMDTSDLYPFKNAIVSVYIGEFTLLDAIDTGWDGDATKGNIWIEVSVPTFETHVFPDPTHYTDCTLNLAWVIDQTLTFDVPDDKTEWSVQIGAYDFDSMSDDDIVDLSPTAGRALGFTINIMTSSITGDATNGIGDGSGDGTESSDDDDGKITFEITVYFE